MEIGTSMCTSTIALNNDVKKLKIYVINFDFTIITN